MRRPSLVARVNSLVPALALVLASFAVVGTASAQTDPGQPAQPGALAPLPPAPPPPPPPPPAPWPPPPPPYAEPSVAPTITPPADPVQPYDVTGSAGSRAVGLPPPGTNFSNFMDTRLTWTWGDDDFLHSVGQLIPLSPTFSIGDRPQYQLFFDNLNSRYNGRENLTHLVMYKKMPAFIPHLTTEAAVVLRFDLAALAANTGNLNQALYDSGSYIRLHYSTNDTHPNEGFSATFFPLDTDRFRVGYLYAISWGGTAASIDQSIFPSIQGSSPGLKLQYDGHHSYAFAGFKTATIVQPVQVLNPGGDNDVEEVQVGQTNYGFLAGAGVDPLEHVRADISGGYFQQGTQNLDDVRGRPVYTYGTSARVVVHDHMPVPQSIDFLLYKNDPMAPMIIFKPETYNPNEFAWSISAEGAAIGQHLKDFDVSGGLKDQAAYALALQGQLRAGYLRVSATGITRNLNFVVLNVPGFIPFETLPKGAQTDPEIFGSLFAQYAFPHLHLTPGIGGGVQLPATFKSEFVDAGIGASRTVVVRAQGNESILPYDQARFPIYQARVELLWDISSILRAKVWMQYIRDNNGTLVVTDPTEGTASLRVFQSPDRLGLAASLQARF